MVSGSRAPKGPQCAGAEADPQGECMRRIGAPPLGKALHWTWSPFHRPGGRFRLGQQGAGRHPVRKLKPRGGGLGDSHRCGREGRRQASESSSTSWATPVQHPRVSPGCGHRFPWGWLEGWLQLAHPPFFCVPKPALKQLSLNF